MKFALSFLLLLAALTAQIDGAAYLVRNATNPAFPGSCYFEGPPATAIKIGEIRRLREGCVQIECDKEYTLTVKGCGLIGPPPGCHTAPKDLSKPYPDCCDELIC